MARAAPGAERTIAVLNWLAAHPDQAFTLTDLVRGLDLNPATCHALLNTLAEAGYVFRDRSKAYRLGPALAAIGEIAHQSFLPIAAARDDMRALSEALGLVCAAAGRVGQEMVILERAVPAIHLGAAIKLGGRYTIEGPVGLSFMAWSAPVEAEAWLDAIGRTRGEAGRRQWVQAVESVRALGFAYGPLDRTGASFPPSLEGPAEPTSLRYVSAPVLNEAGEIIFSIVLQGFDRPYAFAEVKDLGARLRQVCEAARGRIYGHGLGAKVQPGAGTRRPASGD